MKPGHNSSLTYHLENAQERHAMASNARTTEQLRYEAETRELQSSRPDRDDTDYYRGAAQPILFCLYTEAKPNLRSLVLRYFSSVTFVSADGVWSGGFESATVIEILGTLDDLQRITDLAGDIRVANAQDTVIVTWLRVGRLDVAEPGL